DLESVLAGEGGDFGGRPLFYKKKRMGAFRDVLTYDYFRWCDADREVKWFWIRFKNKFRDCFLQAEDGIRDSSVTGVQTCALPIYRACRAAGPGDLPLQAQTGRFR